MNKKATIVIKKKQTYNTRKKRYQKYKTNYKQLTFYFNPQKKRIN